MGQCLGTLGVVTTVEDKKRIAPENFKAGRPVYVPQSGGNSRLRNLPAAFPQHAYRFQNHSGIAELVGTEEREQIFLPMP